MIEAELFDAGYIDAFEGNIPYTSLTVSGPERIRVMIGLSREYLDGWATAMRDKAGK